MTSPRQPLGQITFDARFHGPPGFANGGYACGSLAAHVDGPATVRLFRPLRVGVPMTVHASAEPKVEGMQERTVELHDDEGVIARAWPAGPDLRPPAPPSWDEAVEASKGYVGFRHHVYPTCFVCGPDAEGDCFHVFAGPVPGRDDVSGLVASPWRPPVSFAGDDGTLAVVFVWSALDCPGAFTFATDRPVLLGELSAEIQGTVRAGERHVVTGWEIAADGRKHHTGTAVHAADGELIAVARGLWFVV